jgi:hypothetical protein
MNGYPRHFIDNAMKTPQSIQQKIEYQSSVCLPYIGPASHKIEIILRNEAGIKVYHSSKNKLFRALCTHKGNINESQKPGVYRILVNVVWFTLVKLVEISRYVLRNTRRIARKPSKINLLWLNILGLMTIV